MIWNSLSNDRFIYFRIEMREPIKTAIFLLIATQLLRSVQSSSQQTANCPAHSYPNNQYCSCLPGYIFNCSVSATSIASNAYLNASVGVANFYILTAPTGQMINYYITLVSSDTNGSITDVLRTLDLLVDEGVSTAYAECRFMYNFPQKNVLNLQSSFQLGYQPGTEDPQQLILMVNISNPCSLLLTYNYQTISTNNIFVILGYVAGGLLVAVSIFFIILLYRKRRTERLRSAHTDPKETDISHFDELMPATVISTNLKKETQVCSVCLQQFDFASIIRKTVCGHVFHKDCLDEWCFKNLSCPMCRAELSRMSILKMRIENAKNEQTNDWVMNTIQQQNEELESPMRQPLVGGLQQMNDFIKNNVGNQSL